MKGYDRRGFALQYPSGYLVAIDLSSGGYPYEATSFHDVWVGTREEMEKYLRAGNSEKLKIVSVSVTITVESEEEVKITELFYSTYSRQCEKAAGYTDENDRLVIVFYNPMTEQSFHARMDGDALKVTYSLEG